MFDIIVIGGTNIDIKAKTHATHVAGTSNPGVVSVTPGGVARNISHNLAQLAVNVALVSAVGTDAHGELAVSETKRSGVDISMTLRQDQPTGTYVAVIDDTGELVSAVNDMRILETLTVNHLARHHAALHSARYIIADCNLSVDVLLWLGSRFGNKLIVEPVSVPKSAKLKTLLAQHPIFLATPNRDQLQALTEDGIDLHERGLQNLVVHRGAEGVTVSTRQRSTSIASVKNKQVSDVTGAGDAAVAGLAYGLLKGHGMVNAARFGQAAASLKLSSTTSTAPSLTEHALQAIVKALE